MAVPPHPPVDRIDHRDHNCSATSEVSAVKGVETVPLTKEGGEEEEIRKESFAASCVRRCDGCLPVLADLATDHVRLRLIAPFIILLVYYTLAVIISGSTIDDFVFPNRIDYSTTSQQKVQMSSSMGEGLFNTNAANKRAPKARLTDNRNVGIKGYSLDLGFRAWKPLELGRHVDCSSDNLATEGCDTENCPNGTIFWHQVKDMCLPTVSNNTVTTDILGNAEFSSSAVATGTVGTYTMRASWNNSTTIGAEQTVILEPRVTLMSIDTMQPAFVIPRAPIMAACSTYPKCPNSAPPISMDVYNRTTPIEGVVVSAFSWWEPDYFAQFDQYATALRLNDEIITNNIGATPPYQQTGCDEGPHLAILENTRSSSSQGPRGTASFSNLKVVTSTSPCVFINFQADDFITNWNSRTAGAGAPNYPQVWPIPIQPAKGTVMPMLMIPAVKLVTIGYGLPNYRNPAPNATSTPARSCTETSTADCPFESFDVFYDRSVAPEEEFTVQVQVTQATLLNFNLTEGYRTGGVALAFLVEGVTPNVGQEWMGSTIQERFAGGWEPNLAMPGTRMTKPVVKKLKGIVSAPADANGVATFKLRFSGHGNSGRYGIKFACEGTRSKGILYVSVQNSVSRVDIVKQPSAIPLYPVTPPDAANANTADNYAKNAVVLVLDSQGNGVPYQTASVRLVRGDNHGPIDDVVAQVYIPSKTPAYNAPPHISNSNGTLAIPLRFTFVQPTAVVAMGGVKAIFTVDGVDSEPTVDIKTFFDLTNQNRYTDTCTHLKIITPPPAQLKAPMASFTVKVQALSANGQPISGLHIMPRILRRSNRISEKFKIGWFAACNKYLLNATMDGWMQHARLKFPSQTLPWGTNPPLGSGRFTSNFSEFFGPNNPINPASEPCTTLFTNDNMMQSGLLKSLQSLQGGDMYPGLAEILTAFQLTVAGEAQDYGDEYPFFTDANGEVDLPLYLVDGQNGTMWLQYRAALCASAVSCPGTDYACRSDAIPIQVITDVDTIDAIPCAPPGSPQNLNAIDPNTGGAFKTGNCSAAISPTSTRVPTYNDFYWPWENVSDIQNVATMIPTDKYGNALAGQFTDFAPVAMPNNMIGTTFWQLLKLDIWINQAPGACMIAPNDLENGGFGKCKHVRLNSLAGYGMVGMAGVHPNDAGDVMSSPASNYGNTMILALNGIQFTGAWDVKVTSGGAAGFGGDRKDFWRLRFTNPVEAIEWLQEPSNNGSAIAVGTPFATPMQPRLKLKPGLRNNQALTCQGIYGGRNNDYENNCYTREQAYDCVRYCPSRGAFFIQLAPVNAFFVANGTDDAAFVDRVSNQYWGGSPNAFAQTYRHGLLSGTWRAWTTFFVADAVPGSVFRVGVAASFQTEPGLFNTVWDTTFSNYSAPVRSLPAPVTTAPIMRVSRQPSSDIAIGTAMPTGPTVDVLVPVSTTNKKLLYKDIFVAMLPYEIDGVVLGDGKSLDQLWFISRMLTRNNYCEYQHGYLVTGKCSPSYLPATMEGNYYVVSITFDDFRVNQGNDGVTLTPAFYGDLNLGRQFSSTVVFKSDNMEPMTIRTTPSRSGGLVIKSSPPPRLQVGQVFEVSCFANYNNAPISGLDVTLVVSSSSMSEQGVSSAAATFERLFTTDSQPPLDISAPVFTPGTNVAKTDTFGNAKFVTSFSRGPPKGSYSVYCQYTENIISGRSSQFRLTNPILDVTARATSDGGTDLGTYEVNQDQLDNGVLVTLPSITVNVVRNRDFAGQTPDPVVQTKYMLQTINFQALTVRPAVDSNIQTISNDIQNGAANTLEGSVELMQAEYFELREDLDNTTEYCASSLQLVNALVIGYDSCVNGTSTLSYCGNATVMQQMGSAIEMYRGAVADCSSSIANLTNEASRSMSQMFTAEGNLMRQQLEATIQTVENDLLNMCNGQGIMRCANNIMGMLTSASQQASIANNPVAQGISLSSYADPINVGLLYSNNVSYTIPSVTVRVETAGDFYLQHLLRGIASDSLTFSVKVNQGWKLLDPRPSDPNDPLWSDQPWWFNIPWDNISLLVFCCCFLIGSTKYAHPAIILLSIAMCAFYIWVTVKGRASTEVTIDLVLRICCLSLTIFFYLVALTQVILDTVQGKPAAAGRDHYSRMHRSFEAYVTRLVSPPRDALTEAELLPSMGDDVMGDAAAINLDTFAEAEGGTDTAEESTAAEEAPKAEDGEWQAAGEAFDGEPDEVSIAADNKRRAMERRQLLKITRAANTRRKVDQEKIAAESSIMAHLKASFHSVRTGENPDAFFYPQKMIIAVIVSFAANIAFFIGCWNQAISFRDMVKYRVGAASVQSAFNYIVTLEENLEATGLITLRSQNVDWVAKQCLWISQRCDSLSDAIYHGWIVAAVIGALAFIVGWIIHFPIVRMEILILRKGKHRWDEAGWFPTPTYEKCTILYSIYYIPKLVLNGIFAFAFLAVVCWLAFTLLLWDVTWMVIWNWQFWDLLLPIIIPILINVILIQIFFKLCGTTDHFYFKRFFLVFDLYQTIVGCITGLVSVLMRLIMCVVFMIIAMFRAEHSPMAAWVDRSLMQLDGQSKATGAVVKLAHTHMNPVLCVFAGLLTKEKEDFSNYGMDRLAKAATNPNKTLEDANEDDCGNPLEIDGEHPVTAVSREKTKANLMARVSEISADVPEEAVDAALDSHQVVMPLLDKPMVEGVEGRTTVVDEVMMCHGGRAFFALQQWSKDTEASGKSWQDFIDSCNDPNQDVKGYVGALGEDEGEAKEEKSLGTPGKAAALMAMSLGIRQHVRDARKTVRNRFWVWKLLWENPSLQIERKAFLAEIKEMEDAEEAAKEAADLAAKGPSFMDRFKKKKKNQDDDADAVTVTENPLDKTDETQK